MFKKYFTSFKRNVFNTGNNNNNPQSNNTYAEAPKKEKKKEISIKNYGRSICTGNLKLKLSIDVMMIY